MKMTEAAVAKVSPPAEKRVDYADTVVTGLVLRVTSKGARTWSVAYKAYDAEKKRMVNQRLTLGRYPAVGLKKARALARETLEQVEAGHNPAAEKREARKAQAEDADASMKVENVVADFIELYHKKRKRNRSWKHVERIFANHVLPRWQGRDIREIKPNDLRDILRQMERDGYGNQCNRVLAAVRKFGNWCVEEQYIELSFAVHVKRPMQEVTRDRVLSFQELRDLWAAIESEHYPFRELFKMFILTAQRRSEVANMRWSEIDLQNGLWTIPGAKAKNGRSHEVPLSRQALAILDDLPRFTGGDFVFSTKAGATPTSNFSTAKARIAARADALRADAGRAPIEDWRVHDLRRTAATGMGYLNTPYEIIGRVLNHTPKGVTSIYDRASYLAPKRRALQAWADGLDRVLAGKPLVVETEDEAVVPLRAVQG
jgi:integrase